MKIEERNKLINEMIKETFEYPAGLEQFLPVDEKAIDILSYNFNDKVNENIEKYFNEQKEIKKNIKEAQEKINKKGIEYQENCKKLIDYIKGLSI